MKNTLKKAKMNKKVKKTDVAYQVVAPVASPTKRVSGLKNGQGSGVLRTAARSYEERFVSRYESIPAMPEGLDQPTFSEAANKILKERYLLKGGNLETLETVAERFWHIAYDIASADFDFGSNEKKVFEKAKEFYGLMVKQEFLPNSPTIMNAGKQNGLQYSACFVLPIGDSLPEIFDCIKYAALIHQSGGGTGFAFSRLRPAGSPVKTTGGVSSGPIPFLRVFNEATHSIKQGGTRRGANMGMLRIDHPDVMEFIDCKAVLDDRNKAVFSGIADFLPSDESREYLRTLLLDNQISNFNISVAVTDRFMEAYYAGGDYELVDPHTKEVVGTLNAGEVMERIVNNAWRTGDPGLVFIDRINHSTANPAQDLEEIEATNPCGEQPLAPNDACNLGSINLGKFVLEDGSGVDWESLKRATWMAVHFLDNVVQTNPYTLPQIYEEVHRNRRIGLGVMGWADMLFKLKIAYNSDQATELAEKVMKFINEEGHRSSEQLAEARGAFPNFEHSIYKNGQALRNSTVTTIAPTGTISIIGDCSSGIEPVFALAFLHKAKGAGDSVRVLTIANQTFTEIAKREGFHSDELATKVMDHGSVAGLDDVVPVDWQKVFITAPEINPDWHVKMQAAFQKYTDNGVSKTINLPNSATVEDVKNSYLMAWETGCNGITVYRDGSKSVQVLNVTGSKKVVSSEVTVVEGPIANDSQDTFVHRPLVLRGRTYRMQTPVGEMFITINRDERDDPFEVFVTVGKGGTHTLADAEAIGRLVSLSLRLSRASENNPREVAEKIVSQLRNIGGASHVGFGKDRVMSLADAIAKALSEDLASSGRDDAVLASEASPELVPLNLPEVTQPSLLSGQANAEIVAPKMASNMDICPECGDYSLALEEGCKKCHSCGYSAC